ncbi:MAG: DUF5668 domain-containing protein [Acidobacteriota bacterium]|jgi:hypothetical protein
MAQASSPLVRPRLVLGILVLLVGGVLLADQLGAVSAESAAALWPVVLLALGLVMVLQPDTTNRLAGAVLLVAGVWLLCNALGWWSYSFWHTWPYLLVIVGAWLLYRVQLLRDLEGPADRVAGALGRFDARVTDAPRVGALAFLNAVERIATTPAFESGDFHAVLGSCDIDLGQTGASGVASVDAFALLGRLVIAVPAGWRVESRLLPLLGRVDNACAGADDAPPTVVVHGAAILGRVEIVTTG